jgi:hypothetical protein
MIRIDPAGAQPRDPAWQKWVAAARERRRKLEELGRASPESASKEIDEKFYKAQRVALLDIFHGKCAYCESFLEANQRTGDVEHYRPKGRVTELDGRLVYVEDPAGARRQHPGYYWLAYEWTNLLPACSACNRPGKDAAGSSAGKWDRFPVASYRAFTPEDLAREDPLLLNPWSDEPNEHLKFDTSTGIISWRSDRGKHTVDILGLNRRGLPEDRLRAVDRARAQFRSWTTAIQHRFPADGAREQVDRFIRGLEPYSAIGVLAMREEKDRMDTEWGSAFGSPPAGGGG